MLQHLLASLPRTERKAPTEEQTERSSTDQNEKERLEAVERTLRFVGGAISVRELSKAAQVHEPHLRRLLTKLTADGKVVFDGRSVRPISSRA